MPAVDPVVEAAPAVTLAAAVSSPAESPVSDHARRAEEALARHQKAKQEREAAAELERQRLSAQVAPAVSPVPSGASTPPPSSVDALQREEQFRAREEQLKRQEEEMKRRSIDLARQHEVLQQRAATPPAVVAAPSALRSSVDFSHSTGSHSDFDFAGLGTTPRSAYREEDLDRIRSEIVSLFRGVLGKHEHALISFIDGQNQSKYGSLQRENEDLKRKSSQLEAQLKEATDKLTLLQQTSAASAKELNVVRAKAHVAESRVATLDNQLQLKVAENLKLTQLCDELISSLESSAGGAPGH